MRKIFKWQIDPAAADTHMVYGEFLPKPCILVAEQKGTLCLWAETDDAKFRTTQKEFRIFGTGHDIPAGYVHVGSAVCGEFVWHVYEKL